MKKVAIVTDSNSGITQARAKELGVYVVPMIFYIDGKEYVEGVSITDEEFFEYQKNGSDIKTAQPTIESTLNLWDELLKEFESLVYIPMSSSISGTCQTAMRLSDDYDGKVVVIDNQRISVSQYYSVLDAKALADEGKSALEIKDYLLKEALNASIYLTVETLSYLKKGGRVSPAAAAVGDLLNLKPVLQIQGGLIDAYKNVRGRNKSKQTMIEAMKEDINVRFKDFPKEKMKLMLAHAGAEEEILEWKKEVEEIFGVQVEVAKLALSISTHVGSGTLGIGVMFSYK